MSIVMSMAFACLLAWISALTSCFVVVWMQQNLVVCRVFYSDGLSHLALQKLCLPQDPKLE